MIEDYIRYDQLIDHAMRDVVKKALYKIYNDGLTGNHHLLVSFLTGYEGVEMSPKLKEKYPEEMTIIIQHQYEDLEVTEQNFKIVLSFDGQKERISVPYLALSSFADPGVKFGLKFNILADENLLNESNLGDKNITPKKTISKENPAQEKKDKKPTKKNSPKTSKKTEVSSQKNVIELANFRKKDK